MNSSDVRNKYLQFFEDRGHKIIPSSSLLPENDPTTLFTGSGMQPLLKYLLGEKHPEGKRLVDSQKSFRSQDIEEVGDNRHTTFFEMLGNWSLGDYFKQEQLEWFFEFLTNELELDPERLYVTAFEGGDNIPQDDETIKIWQELFSKVGIEAKVGERIFLYGVKKNWWSRFGTPENMPVNEPGGPDAEVFYQFDVEHDLKFGDECHPNCDCGRFLEIGNSVFMQYIKQEDGSFKELPQKNVDFGGGLERLTAATNNEPDIFKTDLFWPIIERLVSETGKEYGVDNKTTQSLRVIADHIKAAVFLIKDGVLPSNKLQGYVLRRLIRRSSTKLHLLSPGSMSLLAKLVDPILDIYSGTGYFETGDWDRIRAVIEDEVNRFERTLEKGLKELEKNKDVDGKFAFDLYQTYGFPIELTIELLGEAGQKLDLEDFKKEVEKHQQLSRETSSEVFKDN